MPFITKEQRNIVAAIGPQVVGDQCFLYYRDMLRRWRKSPRWTTAHEIYSDLLAKQRDPGRMTDSDLVAHELAWQVFFQLHVVAYEINKRIENGEVATDENS